MFAHVVGRSGGTKRGRKMTIQRRRQARGDQPRQRTPSWMLLAAAIIALAGLGGVFAAAPAKARSLPANFSRKFEVIGWKVQVSASYSGSGQESSGPWSAQGQGTWTEHLHRTTPLDRVLADGTLVFFGKHGGGAIIAPMRETYETHCAVTESQQPPQETNESDTVAGKSGVEIESVGNGRARVTWNPIANDGCFWNLAYSYSSFVQIAELTSPKVVRLHAQGHVPLRSGLFGQTNVLNGSLHWQTWLTMKRLPASYGLFG